MAFSNPANDDVDDDTWYWFLLEVIIGCFLFYGIQEFNRLPKFIYINTSLVIITFIVCAIFIYIIEYGEHDWFYLIKYPLLPGLLLVVLLARVNAISKDESIKPYLQSVHFWLIWISDKIFGGKNAKKGFSWFVYIAVIANILSPIVEELKGNKLYIYNVISGFIVCLLVPIPLCYGTNKAVAKVDDTPFHDLSWNLHICWFTLYSIWQLSYIAWYIGDSVQLHIVILSAAYARGLMHHRNDLWAHARIVTLSVVAFWRIPNAFRFSRWLLHYAPWQLDDSERGKLLDAFEWITFANMIFGALYMLYVLYSVIKNRVQSAQDKASEEREDGRSEIVPLQSDTPGV